MLKQLFLVLNLLSKSLPLQLLLLLQLQKFHIACIVLGRSHKLRLPLKSSLSCTEWVLIEEVLTLLRVTSVLTIRLLRLILYRFFDKWFHFAGTFWVSSLEFLFHKVLVLSQTMVILIAFPSLQHLNLGIRSLIRVILLGKYLVVLLFDEVEIGVARTLRLLLRAEDESVFDVRTVIVDDDLVLKDFPQRGLLHRELRRCRRFVGFRDFLTIGVVGGLGSLLFGAGLKTFHT